MTNNEEALKKEEILYHSVYQDPHPAMHVDNFGTEVDVQKSHDVLINERGDLA